MTSFVESCIETVADSAEALARRTKGRPSAGKLLKQLAGKKSVLVTTHQHPDPDALASAHAMSVLLRAKLPGTKVETSIKGQIAGGINEAFAKHCGVQLTPWNDAALASYDAILLLDCQPGFSYNPVPSAVPIKACIDHHRSKKGRRPQIPFADIRIDVGATSSIIFSYFMELEVPISPHLGATLLYAIESDLAGAAGAPGDLDNIALSGLTLIADPKKLYQMRYVKLSQSYYTVFAEGLQEALVYDKAIITHLTHIDSFEKPAVLADMFLRYDKVEWSLVTALHNNRLLLSLRTSNPQPALVAADVMAKLVRGLGDGGGHRAKAGGTIPLTTSSDAEIERIRTKLRQRLNRALSQPKSRGQRLVP